MTNCSRRDKKVKGCSKEEACFRCVGHRSNDFIVLLATANPFRRRIPPRPHSHSHPHQDGVAFIAHKSVKCLRFAGASSRSSRFFHPSCL